MVRIWKTFHGTTVIQFERHEFIDTELMENVLGAYMLCHLCPYIWLSHQSVTTVSHAFQYSTGLAPVVV